MGKSHLFEIPFSRYFSCKSFSETWESHLAANSTQQKLCCMFPHNNEASTHQKQFPCKLSQFEKQNVIIPFSPPSWKGGQRIPFYRNPIFKVLFLFSFWEPKSHFIEIPFSREGTVLPPLKVLEQSWSVSKITRFFRDSSFKFETVSH